MKKIIFFLAACGVDLHFDYTLGGRELFSSTKKIKNYATLSYLGGQKSSLGGACLELE